MYIYQLALTAKPITFTGSMFSYIFHLACAGASCGRLL